MKQNQNQEKVWDAIAEQWFHFRQRPPHDVQIWLNILVRKWKKGKLLELGCGACRNLLIFANAGFDCYGIDFSNKMLKQAERYCRKYKFKVKLKRARANKLPFKNNSFDYVLYIGVLHHLNKKERLESLKEIKRVLKKDGEAYISVWNKLIPRFFFKPKDYYVPWHVMGKVYWRYYHLFTYWELKNLINKAGFHILNSSGLFGNNLCFLIRNSKENSKIF